MTVTVKFHVAGRPQQRGSKKAIPRKDGGRPLMVDANSKSGPWMATVAMEASAAMQGRPLIAGPVEVTYCFRFKYSKGHYTKKGLRPTAPVFYEKAPDLDKLARAAGDAMTGVVYRDDKQIVRLITEKRYTESSEGLDVIVSEVT